MVLHKNRLWRVQAELQLLQHLHLLVHMELVMHTIILLEHMILKNILVKINQQFH